MATIKKALEYKQTELSFEHQTNKVSKTIPDQTMSLRELIDQSLLNPVNDNQFLGEDELANKAADIDKMELTDRNEFAEKLATDVKEKTAKLKAEQNAAKDKREQDKINAAALALAAKTQKASSEQTQQSEKPKDDK